MEKPGNQQCFALVVEDEPLVRMLGVDVLESAGFVVIEACNADEALAVLARRSDISVVFTDVDMPGSLDGLDLAWRIHECWPGIGVVLTSGRYTIEPRLMPREDAFVPKPYAVSSLLAQIERVVARASAERDR
ncbi:Response regulator receiver protein [Methylocella tundrae]|uniref:Response regulator receiver protein n=1 Tax=Methylocella tundrae TaxID=227605 RepID=A0A8B6M4A6_METTU|nr:response regulator [Methylocella tundrae]VTZ49851.1 Response regulator receiver protein [Methylocella tundrae]